MNSPPARGGVPAQAGGVVGARGAHVTTPSAPHPPLLKKEGSKAGPVILLGALSIGSGFGQKARHSFASPQAIRRPEGLFCVVGGLGFPKIGLQKEFVGPMSDKLLSPHI